MFIHRTLYSYTGCPPKKWDLCLNTHNIPCKWPTDKSRVSFGKFRKFPVQWAQEHLIFRKLWMRKSRSKLPTPPLKNYNFGNLGNFDLNFPIHFFPKSRCSCAQWKGNFLNFPKLTLLLSIVHLQGWLRHLNTNPTFFGTPCTYNVLK